VRGRRPGFKRASPPEAGPVRPWIASSFNQPGEEIMTPLNISDKCDAERKVIETTALDSHNIEANDIESNVIQANDVDATDIEATVIEANEINANSVDANLIEPVESKET
jgi:hypothetical protein